MAIRLRLVKNKWIALCAARSIPKEGDMYLDDNIHEALSNKFARDYNEMFDTNLPGIYDDSDLVDQEESNNPNRDWWNKEYGIDHKTIG